MFFSTCRKKKTGAALAGGNEKANAGNDEAVVHVGLRELEGEAESPRISGQ